MHTVTVIEQVRMSCRLLLPVVNNYRQVAEMTQVGDKQQTSAAVIAIPLACLLA